MVYVFNKVDKIEVFFLIMEGEDWVIVLVKQDSFIDLIVKVICQYFFKDYQEVILLVLFVDGYVVFYFNEYIIILDIDYLLDGIKLWLEIVFEDLYWF